MRAQRAIFDLLLCSVRQCSGYMRGKNHNTSCYQNPYSHNKFSTLSEKVLNVVRGVAVQEEEETLQCRLAVTRER